MTLEELRNALDDMVRKGNTFRKTKNGKKVYANAPFVVGMYEFQIKRLTPDFLKDTNEYVEDSFAAELLSTPQAPQTRIIPIGESIKPEWRVGTYELLRNVIEDAGGRISIGECICRKVRDLAGEPCSVSPRREVCMTFRDFSDWAEEVGWGRRITKKEALEIAQQNEEDGFVVQPSNEREPQFICNCCGDCCGILRLAKAVPRATDVVATNYYAEVDRELCESCETCIERCQMGAAQLDDDDIATVDLDSCIGCGLCVTSCTSGAMHLVKKEDTVVPPKDLEELYAQIMMEKRRKLELQ
jgi:ferredoxin